MDNLQSTPEIDTSPLAVYLALGFARHEGASEEAVPAGRWRALQSSDKLDDMRAKTLLQRDRAGAPLTDAGYVVGWIPPLNLPADQVEKLLCTLTLALSRGCTRVAEWQRLRNTL